MIPWVARIRTTRVEIVENPVRQIVTKGLAGYGGLTRTWSPPLKSWPASPVFRGTRIGVKHVADLVRKRAKLVAASARYWFGPDGFTALRVLTWQESYSQSNRTGITDIPRIRLDRLLIRFRDLVALVSVQTEIIQRKEKFGGGEKREALYPNDPPFPLSRGSQQIMVTLDGWKTLDRNC